MSETKHGRPRGALAILVLVACGDASEAQLGASASGLIVDAVHNGGDPRFYFLAPTVPAPSYRGTLDRTLDPAVRIERMGPRGLPLELIARFTSAGRGAAGVRPAVDGWSVRWATAGANLDPAEDYRITVEVNGTAIGFADLDVVARPQDLRLVDRTRFAAVARGDGLLIRFRIEGGQAQPWRDGDGDGVADTADNCPAHGNPSQDDGDGNGIGDACECAGHNCGTLTCHEPSTCDRDTGACIDVPLRDGTSCDDGDACTTGDACLGGTCGASATLSCDDGEACTADTCDPGAGCIHRTLDECRYSGRPCRGDGFFVEVYDQSIGPSWSSNNFLTSAPSLHVFETHANTSGYPWFCGLDQVTCPTGQVRLAIAPLLDELPSPPYPAVRGDGHLRAYRVHFIEAATGDRLTVRPGAQCAVVSELRAAFAAAAGATLRLSVGRECDASTLAGLDGQPSDAMSSWHLDRIGTATAALVPPALGADHTDVALIDTGVVPGVASAIGVISEMDLVGVGALHKHGTGMSILIRQIAPFARIRSYRVLDENGASTSAMVARAVDHALFGQQLTDQQRPLVINFSIGWPAELSRSTLLEGAGCTTEEGPLGESIRYTLRVARELDQAPAASRRPVLVIAAAGNQPGFVDPSVFPPAVGGSDPPPCAGQPALVSPPWFFPAQWNHVYSCVTTAAGRPTVLGVSAVDDRELASGLSIPGAESPLVAPGEHVYVDAPDAAPTAQVPACTTLPYPPDVTLPAVFTGSSVASALVAAAASRVQQARVAASQPPLDARALASLLYLGGDTVCEGGAPRVAATPAGPAIVRRLHAARLDHAVSAPECGPLITCAASAAPYAGALHHCRYALEACGLEAVDPATDTLQLACAPAAPPVGWPSGYVAPICPADGTFGALGTVDDASTCSNGCYGAPYRSLLGSFGPQPSDPGCGECRAQVSSGAATATLQLQLNAALIPGTTFTKKYVQYSGWDLSTSSYKTYYTSLDNPATDAKWFPGASLVVSAAAPPAMSWASAKVTLIMTVDDGESTPALDYSPLRVDVVP